MMGTWWPVDQGFLFGVMGGSIGAICGVAGGILGYLLPRGIGHRGVLTGLGAIGVGGLVCAAVGIGAIVDDQPFGIYYPLLLYGCILYWMVEGLLPHIDMAYRAVLANRGAGAQPRPVRGVAWFGILGGAESLGAAVLQDDWRSQGRYGRWVKPLMGRDIAVGSVILALGVWQSLSGAELNDLVPGMMLGFGFLLAAGQLWLVKAMVIRWSSRPAERQRLAAEELRRS